MALLNSDIFGTTVAALLTLVVYSYLLRDNPLYRLAEHLLVATGVAYALVVAVHAVLLPRLLVPLATDAAARPDLLVPLVLGVLLLAKAVPRGAALGNPSLGYLVGVGLALAAGGALVGTLLPQATAAMLPLLPGSALSPAQAGANLVATIGTVAVLLSFLYYRGRGSADAPPSQEPAPTRPPWWRTVGRWFLMVALGAIFGGTLLTFFALLIGRWDFLINDWLPLFVAR